MKEIFESTGIYSHVSCFALLCFHWSFMGFAFGNWSFKIVNIAGEVARLYKYWIMLSSIGPESDHQLYLSLTHSLTDPEHLVNLIDATLACEDTNLKYVEVVTVTVADVDNEGHVVNSLIQI